MSEILASAAPRLSVSVALAPAASVLNSMALLDAAARMPALDAWVLRTAAGLSEQQRRNHRLVLAILSGGLLPESPEQEFPAYLDALARLPAERIAAAAAALAALPDPELHVEVDALAADPLALHDLLVTHLRDLWEHSLSGEWARAQPRLRQQAEQLRGRLEGPEGERLAADLGRFIGAEQLADLADLRQAVYVPAPHNGRYLTRLVQGATIYLFFDAPRAMPVLLRSTPVERAEALARLEALGDEVRLRILDLFGHQDLISAQEIMERLGLTQSTTSRALKQLGAFLLESRERDGKKSYRLAPAQIELTFSALRQQVAAGTPAPAPTVEQEHSRELRRFLDEQGRVTSWPAKDRDKQMIFGYLASRFEPQRQYSEKEVNAIIRAHMHPDFQDFVTMRRELCNYCYLVRERDGSRYWQGDLALAGWPRPAA
ncbi:MAG TPA: DUF2087 domain-containing protein [Roseiflexaceae bacterium]|nr:DUF2087 domain-containing protein [Roseiflexaceae bacterium]